MSAEMTVVPMQRETGLALHGGAGTLAMATMSEGEFQERLAALKKGQERIRTIKRELMNEGTHYGVIPGTDKPTLYKPGAEVLCSIYGLRADFVPVVRYGDGDTEPAIRVSMRCELHLGDLTGPVVAVGVGAANSWERKHRYRRSERSCPECGAAGAVRRSTFENKRGAFEGQKGWWCKECRTNWENPKEPKILEQQTGDIENPDQHDLENTLVKMAKKRAHLDAALTGTASSDIFTQDLDEQEHHEAPAKSPAAAMANNAAAASSAPPDDPFGEEMASDAYERHDVEPPPPGAGKIPACPTCGAEGGRVMASKRPEKGAYYCKPCGKGYGPKS